MPYMPDWQWNLGCCWKLRPAFCPDRAENISTDTVTRVQRTGLLQQAPRPLKHVCQSLSSLVPRTGPCFRCCQTTDKTRQILVVYRCLESQPNKATAITPTFFTQLCLATTCKFFWKTVTHTHTRLTALFPGLPGWAGTRKVKPIWILLNQETVSGSGISWAICKSAPRFRQITTPAPHHSVFCRPDALPAAQPTASKHWRQQLGEKWTSSSHAKAGDRWKSNLIELVFCFFLDGADIAHCQPMPHICPAKHLAVEVCENPPLRLQPQTAQVSKRN